MMAVPGRSNAQVLAGAPGPKSNEVVFVIADRCRTGKAIR